MRRAKSGGDKEELPSKAVLALLSTVLPGAGQLANGQTVKGWTTISVSIAIMIAFFYQIAMVGAPIYSAAIEGRQLIMDDAYIDLIKTLGWILLGAFAVWAYALIDSVLVGGKRLSAKSSRR